MPDRASGRYGRWALMAVALAMPLAAQADVVWPALYLETRLFSWWAIGLGLAVEFFFIRKLFALPPGRALLADLAANSASALLGVVLIPLSGLAWEVFPGFAFYYLLHVGTFNPITWAGTFALACLINAWLESYVLKQFFKLPWTRRTFAWLVLANACSVGVAFASLWWKPVQL
ncbi:hypothetical protein EZJ19_11060 [Parasulfuritortus cantonensis]|uniref:Uncharacterized protein n=1 Tax=Parasulfuritortus cantonensis TaxID=2528202 RepID=A0A4R1B3W5_9PROT|nr:hypothetical protein [Parasulfuritortus cantonensis]TCJ12772.1 hypothetical protein EZJ19_11060 [Parasulfuritortus cantonensis]